MSMYTPPTGGAVALAFTDAQGTRPGDAVALAFTDTQAGLPFPQSGDAVALAFQGAYTPPAANAVDLAHGPELGEPEPTDPYPPFRGPAIGVGTPWGATAARARATRGTWAELPHRHGAPHLPWGTGEVLARTHTTPWGALTRAPRIARVPWPQHTRPERRALHAPWRDVARKRTHYHAPWTQAARAPRPQARLPYLHLDAKHLERAAPWAETAQHPRHAPVLPWRTPPPKREQAHLPWGWSWPPRWGEHLPEPEPPPPEPEPEPTYTPPPGGAVALELRCPLPPDADLYLGLECAPTPIQPGRTRTVTHTITVERLDDGASIAVDSLTLTTDLDAWAWDFEARVLGEPSLQKLQHDADGPRAVLVTVDAEQWIVLAERYHKERLWERTQRSVAGRSRAAFLAAPYAPAASAVEGAGRSAQQLADDALTFTDWTLVWEIPDWFIPGGVYSYQELTPIERITRIAEAAGAVVLSAPADKTLTVRSRYPVSPWDWASATPDVVITATHIRAAASRWSPAPVHDRVHVLGREQGVHVRVTRTGAAGTLPGADIVDPLITDVDVGRERGRVALSEGGAASHVTLELPFEPASMGLLEPGQLAEIEDSTETWRGLITAVTLRATRTYVRQHVDIERRYAE